MAGVLLWTDPVVLEAVVKRPLPEPSFRNPCRHLCPKQGGLVAFSRRGRNVGDHEHGVPCLWHKPWHKRIDVIPSRLPGACCYGGKKRKNRPPLHSSRCVWTLARLNTKPRETNITVETLYLKGDNGQHDTISRHRIILEVSVGHGLAHPHLRDPGTPVPQHPPTSRTPSAPKLHLTLPSQSPAALEERGGGPGLSQDGR